MFASHAAVSDAAGDRMPHEAAVLQHCEAFEAHKTDVLPPPAGGIAGSWDSVMRFAIARIGYRP